VESLVAALRDPTRYPHPVQEVEVVETHISWVLLAGDYAYKLKKPVRLPFLDFSSLEARRRFCEEELRLNRRTAPELYLEVVPIVRTGQGPALDGAGEPIEYAVKMRRFAASALADRMAREGALGAPQVDAIAAALAAFHAAVPRAGPGEAFGSAAQVTAQAHDNFEQIAALGPGDAHRARLERLRAWTGREGARLGPAFEARRAAGFVRECHGDLHLGNIAFEGARALPFDCIEFDPALRWIDVMSEVAFLVMDLHAHALSGLAWRLLGAWLEASGDYEGLRLLRFYSVYRAMVRAKIACIRGDARESGRYLELAEELARPGRPALLLMHGVSGSGKTTLSQAMLERLGAVRVRSDVERKRLHGLAPLERTGAGLDAGIYDLEASERTYARLGELARAVLEAGYAAIVDAAFLRRAQRDRLRRLAREQGVRLLLATCTASEEALLARVSRRAAGASDASDAGLAVLEQQLAGWQPLGAGEKEDAVTVDTGSAASLGRGLDEIAARLAEEKALAPH
jgi:aminoglycoside phosphotransferase family enzyme/predicted kinase